MTKIIGVTGAGGYVGNVLVRDLLALGLRVRALDNFHKGQCDSLLSLVTNPNFEFMYGDVTVLDHMKKFVEGLDGIIHLAAIVGLPACNRQPALSKAVNVDGTLNLLKAIELNNPKCRLVFASTGSVYGKIDNICDETTKTNPQSIYGKHKLEAETAVLSSNNSIAFRFATGFGVSPCMRVNLLVNDLVYQAINNKTFTLFEADARRTFIHVKDMSKAFINGFTSSVHGRVYNCGHESLNWSKRKLAEYIQQKTGCHVCFADVGKDGDARDYEVNYSKIQDELGFVCNYTMERGIDELIKATPLLQIRHNYE